METNRCKQENGSGSRGRNENGEYVLGSFTFCPEPLILRRYGLRIDLAYQPALMLKALLEARYHFLTHAEIAAVCWPVPAARGESCSERLATAASRLRKALRPDASVKLLCVSKRGYELVVERETIPTGFDK